MSNQTAIPSTLAERFQAIFEWFGWRNHILHPLDKEAMEFYEQNRRIMGDPTTPMVVLLEARVRELTTKYEDLERRVTNLDDPTRR